MDLEHFFEAAAIHVVEDRDRGLEIFGDVVGRLDCAGVLAIGVVESVEGRYGLARALFQNLVEGLDGLGCD